jgi:sulfate permease, SulP family
VLAAIAIPEQIATARLANMPAQTGLYAFVAGSLAFAAFGVNRYVSVGADSTIAPIFAGSIAAIAAANPERYPSFVATLALLTGVVLVVAGAVRAGWIADLLSIPVTIGFLAGIAVHIIVGQLPAVLGIAEPQGALLYRLAAIAAAVPQANGSAVAIGAAVLAVTWGADRINKRIPGPLIALAGATSAVAVLHLSTRGVAVLGALPRAFPTIELAVIPVHDAVRLVPLAFIVALVCVVQTAVVVRSFPSQKGKIEGPGGDFAAVGVGSLAASLVGAFAVDASPPRTAAVVESGGHSQLAGIVAVVAVVALISFASGLTAFLPLAALGGVLVFIGMRIFRLGDMIRIARYGGPEIWFVVAAAVLVVALPIETGMLLSIALSLTRGIYIIARPPSTELLHIRGTTIWWPPNDDEPSERISGVVVFAPVAPIAFTNGQYIAERLEAAVEAAPKPVRLVVIEGGGVSDVDFTGSRVMSQAIGELRARGITVAIARLSDPRAQAAAERTGLIAAVGADHVFKSVHEAVERLVGYSTGDPSGA